MNLIYQCHIARTEPRFVTISSEAFRKYAGLCKADYTYSSTQYFKHRKEWKNLNFYYEIFRLIYDPSFDVYDNILFVDTDVIPITNISIFDSVNLSKCDIMACFEKHMQGLTDTSNQWINNCRRYGIEVNDWHKFYNDVSFNTGVVLFTKKARQQMRQAFDSWDLWMETYDDSIWEYTDQPFFNIQCYKHNINVAPMNTIWNSDYLNPVKDARFIHYSNYQGKEQLVKDYG